MTHIIDNNILFVFTIANIINILTIFIKLKKDYQFNTVIIHFVNSIIMTILWIFIIYYIKQHNIYIYLSSLYGLILFQLIFVFGLLNKN